MRLKPCGGEGHLPGGGRDGGTYTWSIQQTGRLGSLPVPQKLKEYAASGSKDLV